MPRRARLSSPGIPWHIIHHRNHRSAFFYADKDYRRYLDTLKEQAEKYDCLVHTYVLMTKLCLTTDTDSQQWSFDIQHHVSFTASNHRCTGGLSCVQ